jgi:GNAT superfamily N-acetyltransferase
MQNACLIRPATLADAPALTGLIRGLGWLTHFNTEPLDTSRRRIARHLDLCLSDDSHSIYLAETGPSEVAGYAAVHWLPYLIFRGPEGFISELFIAEAARGRGIGSQLLAAIKAEAQERGCTRLSLLNNRERESYRRGFYDQQGWYERQNYANFVFPLE